MKASDYIRAYAMQRKGTGLDCYYERRFEKNGNIVSLSIKKIDMTNECFFVKKIFYRKKLNLTTGMVGVWGEPKMTFGIIDDIFENNNEQEFEM